MQTKTAKQIIYVFRTLLQKKRQSKLKVNMIIKCDPKISRSQIHYNTEICQVIDVCVCEKEWCHFLPCPSCWHGQRKPAWPLEPRQLKPSCTTFTPSMSNTSEEPWRSVNKRLEETKTTRLSHHKVITMSSQWPKQHSLFPQPSCSYYHYNNNTCLWHVSWPRTSHTSSPSPGRSFLLSGQH